MKILLKMRSIKAKFFLVVMIMLAFYTITSFLYFQYNLDDQSPTKFIKRTSLYWRNVLVHIDMKGAPPKLNYLIYLLPFFRGYGATGLLIEYEDMFPYEGHLAAIRSKNCYERNKLSVFLRKAVEAGLEVIPYIQTFGQMEHVLKLDEFKHLRESPDNPDMICPLKEESKQLIGGMLQQVIEFHRSIYGLRYVHVGCGATHLLGTCDACLKKDKSQLLLDHLCFLSEEVQHLSDEVNLLVWDDILGHFNKSTWGKYIIDRIEPVLRTESTDTRIYKELTKLSEKVWIKHLWIASPFKGADGPTSSIPNMRKRLKNLLTWMEKAMMFKCNPDLDEYKVFGIILTGASRYNHTAPLVDLLPASIPSLILNLLLIGQFCEGFAFENDEDIFDLDKFYKNYLYAKVNESFSYVPNNVSHGTLQLDDINGNTCFFVGALLYNMLNSTCLNENVPKIEEIVKRINFNKYYSKSKYYMRNEQDMKDLKWVNESLNEIKDLEKDFRSEMSLYYFNDTIDEYFSLKIDKVKTQLQWAFEALSNITKIKKNNTYNKETIQTKSVVTSILT